MDLHFAPRSLTALWWGKQKHHSLKWKKQRYPERFWELTQNLCCSNLRQYGQPGWAEVEMEGKEWAKSWKLWRKWRLCLSFGKHLKDISCRYCTRLSFKFYDVGLLMTGYWCTMQQLVARPCCIDMRDTQWWWNILRQKQLWVIGRGKRLGITKTAWNLLFHQSPVHPWAHMPPHD